MLGASFSPALAVMRFSASRPYALRPTEYRTLALGGWGVRLAPPGVEKLGTSLGVSF